MNFVYNIGVVGARLYNSEYQLNLAILSEYIIGE